MVREIVRDTIFLQQRSVPATADDREVITDLVDTLIANSDRCVGLAANMIGINKTILAAFLRGKVTVMVNPIIIDRSAAEYEAEEACLSLTGVRKVKRNKVITVEYLDKTFKKKKSTYRGFDAEIIQHEIDHFSGILI